MSDDKTIVFEGDLIHDHEDPAQCSGCQTFARKVAEVTAVEKMPHCEKPCRHCGHVYERGCAGHDTEPEGPLSRCPQCHCPADPPLNAPSDPP